jgi:hypothetical protein
MARHLFIAARGHPDLYAHLQRGFSENPDFEVLVDRRQSERRQGPESHEPKLRHGERWGQRGSASHVRGIGVDAGVPMLIVELAPATTP